MPTAGQKSLQKCPPSKKGERQPPQEVRMVSHAILVRKPALDFEKAIERFYFGQDPVKTYIFNALNLLFPEGERFFVESVK